MRSLTLLTLIVVLLLAAGAASAQSANTEQTVDISNPLSVLEQASRALPIQQQAPSNAPVEDAQIDQPGGLSATISIMMLLTVLSLVPAVLIMCTSFTRIIVVLALLRQAIGTQGLPPSQVLMGLSLFLTFMIMAPTLEKINNQALAPLQAGHIDEREAWVRAKEPIRTFMFDQIEHSGNWDDVYMILQYRGVDISEPENLTTDDVDMLTLVPAFILSELKVAFLMGFRLYLPFLVIDMVVASVLLSMGMLMLPPVMISLPFKLLLFVLVDGWQLVAGSLLNSFVV
jgi:flagellar biosynthetic protein FliP